MWSLNALHWRYKIKCENTAIVILGPTCSGKTHVSIELAKKYHTEIINADARQIYKELNIGVDKPSVEQLDAIPHYFLSTHSILEPMNAYEFGELAVKKLYHIFKRNRVAIVVGGSGLYIKSLCEGMDKVPKIPPIYRKQLIEEYKNNGVDDLLKELKEKDISCFQNIDKNNPHRIIRALEVIRATQSTFSKYLSSKKKKRKFRVIKIGIDKKREELYTNINLRVDRMVKEGLFQEAEKFLDYKYLPSLQTLGYRESFLFLEKKIEKEECISLIKRNTRRLAKRQLTWFNKDKEIQWFENEEKIFEFLEKTVC